MPIVAALERLQASFPNPQGDIRAVYDRLRTSDLEIAHVLGQLVHAQPALPLELPTFDEIKRASNPLRTAVWADSTVPRTGLEKMSLDRTLRAARGED
jgi:hypothetical protein